MKRIPAFLHKYVYCISSIFNESYCNLYYRCVHPSDDPFRACFGCENAAAKTSYDHYGNYYPDGYQDYNNYIERQTGERFHVTRQSSRVVCRRECGRRKCKLRTDRAMQVRQVTYGKANQFIQSEQYLSADDLDIIRY